MWLGVVPLVLALSLALLAGVAIGGALTASFPGGRGRVPEPLPLVGAEQDVTAPEARHVLAPVGKAAATEVTRWEPPAGRVLGKGRSGIKGRVIIAA